MAEKEWIGKSDYFLFQAAKKEHKQQKHKKKQSKSESIDDSASFKVPSLPPGASPRRPTRDPLSLEPSSPSPHHALSPWHMPAMSPIPGLISPIRRSEFSDSDSDATGLTPRRDPMMDDFRLTPQPTSPVKMTLKKTSSNEQTWNVQSSSTEDESSVNNKKDKLDKVLLSLKKNKKNTWNVQDKSSSNSASSSVKQQKRSRKSEKGQIKKVEKKAEEDSQQSEFVLPTKIMEKPSTNQSDVIIDLEGQKKAKKPPPPTPPRRTYSKKESPEKAKVLQSLQNKLMFSTGINGISIDISGGIDSPATEINPTFSPGKLNNVINSAANFDDENREFRSLIRNVTSNDNSTDFLLKIQKSLPNQSKQENFVACRA